MPITRPNMNLYSINNLALDYDPGRGRYGLSLECPRADAFTLCLGKNLPLADPEKLGLTEEELRRLHNGHSMDKGGYRLIGVTQGTFYAMPVFRGFEADPPQTIQVWSMMAVPGGIVHLYYTPGREAVCFIPLRYSRRAAAQWPSDCAAGDSERSVYRKLYRWGVNVSGGGV